ncbi:hypothetical protein [Microbacterium aurantiacum]|uniref:hypothetical protein n=1 Tax=Microbacterium aurantiacum TaxID=162393 RepID=UPI0034264E95
MLRTATTLAGQLTRQPEFSGREVSRRLMGRLPFTPRIVAARLGADSSLVGIGALTAEHVRDATYLR